MRRRDPPDWEINSQLHELFIDFATKPAPLKVLIEGPAGCGKTTLVHNAARHSHLPVLEFPVGVLACRSAENVEESVSEIFSDAVERAPCVLFIDDVDHWLPKRMANPAQFHLLAHLHEALRELDEHPAPNVAFVVVTRIKSELHPALAHDSLRVVPVRPLVEHERATIIRNALKCNDESDNEVDALVVRTPGFVAVDMAQLLLEARRIARGSTLTLNHIDSALAKVRPLLLGEHGKRWCFSMAGNIDNCSSSPLYGLTASETSIRTALNAAFSRRSHVSLDAMGRVRGILVYGPTGSGKTALLSRAARWLPRGTVHVLRVDAVDVVDAVIGAAERAITRLFAAARAAAPTLLLLENVHLLAPRRDHLDVSRSDGGGGASAAFERILATLLVELDGVRRCERAVVLLASTPSLELVEPAMLRPGRLELHVRTELPNIVARRSIFEDTVHEVLPNATAADVLTNDELIDDVVRVTAEHTAADIKSIVSETVFSILRSDGLLDSTGTKLKEASKSLTSLRLISELRRNIMEFDSTGGASWNLNC